jgi:sn-glycerol 3-phosphate transport system substrate-binding protein
MTDRNPRLVAPARRRIAAVLLAATATVTACSTGDADSDADSGNRAATANPDQSSRTTPDTDPATAATEAATTDAPAAPPARCLPPDDGDETPTTLRIWHGFDGDSVGFFDEVIAAFESEHPWIDVEASRFEGNYMVGIEQLAVADTADRPDIFMGSNSSVRLQFDSGLFVPPSECTDGETPDALRDLLPIIERTYTVGDTLVAAPYNVSTPVLMYDRSLWRAAGLDPDDPPATLDELEVVVRRLRDSGTVSNGMVLYDRAASWLIEQAASQEGRLLVLPANGREGTSIDDVRFGDPRAVAALEQFRVLHREGYIRWVGLNQSGRDDLLQLANVEDPAGLTLHTSASLGDVLRVIESGSIGAGVEAGVGPLPGNAPGGLVGGGAWWLLAQDDPARVGAAWTLVDWLIQPDRVAELAAFTGYVPTTERAAASSVTTERWAQRPILRVGYEQLASMPATAAAAGLQVGPVAEVRRALEVAAKTAIVDDQDPGEELLAAQASARTVLDTYASVYGSPD